MDDKNTKARLAYNLLIAVGCAALIALYPSLIVVAGGLALVWVVLLPAKERPEYQLLFVGFLVAFLVRALMVLGTFYVSYSTGQYVGFGPDGLTYSGNAWALVSMMKVNTKEWLFNRTTFPFPYSSLPYWAPEILTGRLPHISVYSTTPWMYFILAVYWLFGFVPLTVQLLNCLMGATAALIQYFIAKKILGKKVAIRLFPVLLFVPSIMVWSTTMLKEPILYLTLSLVFLLFLKLKKTNVLITVLVMVGLTIATYVYYPKFEALASHHITRMATQKKAASRYEIYSKGVRGKVMQQEGRADPWDKASGLAWGLASFHLRPHAWEARSLKQVALIPQMLVWYLVVPLSIIGAAKVLTSNPSLGVWLMVFFVVVATSIVALSSGNEGVLVRHRDILVPYYLIFAAGFFA
ncbi:hypothetical protein LCGC14_1183660 [marine sediment metagenome]|uniref:Glycosyltransferase RgtA/B/C/D-like domain-containing protein n=1 Tax=marine sediment metagenome TaxID=412755 RepID=A0A0F9LLI3_9ZZZZ